MCLYFAIIQIHFNSPLDDIDGWVILQVWYVVVIGVNIVCMNSFASHRNSEVWHLLLVLVVDAMSLVSPEV